MSSPSFKRQKMISVELLLKAGWWTFIFVLSCLIIYDCIFAYRDRTKAIENHSKAIKTLKNKKNL